MKSHLRLYANPINTEDVRFAAVVTNVIYEANIEGLELEILQLRNNLKLLDKFFCKTAQHTGSHVWVILQWTLNHT